MTFKNLQKTNKDITRVFSIAGMSCFSCVQKIESIISKIPSVRKVEVNLGESEAIVLYDPFSVKKNDIASAIESEGYKVKGIYKIENRPANNHNRRSVFLSTPSPYIKGVLAAIGITGFYLGLLTLTSDWYFAKVQFEDYRVWILLLATGLGIQVFLYSILRLHIRQTKIAGVGKSLAASGGLSTAGMAACCAHYLVTVLPVLGVPFVSTAIAALERYQTVFFFIGVLSNVLGILFMLNLMKKNKLISMPEVFIKFRQDSESI